MAAEEAYRIKFVKLTQRATLPSRFLPQASGLDLHSAHHLIIPPLGKTLIFTDLATVLPHGCYGRIAGRSGIAIKIM